jgi:hypothetical protein
LLKLKLIGSIDRYREHKASWNRVELILQTNEVVFPDRLLSFS